MQTRYITATYEHALQYAYSRIERRGLAFDTARLQDLKAAVNQGIDSHLQQLGAAWGCFVYSGAHARRNGVKLSAAAKKDGLNIGGRKLLTFLKDKGYHIPKIAPTKQQRQAGLGHRESLSELSLRKLFAETASEEIRHLLDVAKLITLLQRYIDVILIGNTFYSNYDVAGTKTGRRASGELIFGWGGNAQNIPKYGAWAKRYRRCIIPRCGKVFLNVDQVSAEEWPVSALARNEAAIRDLAAGVNRHKRLAAFIFQRPESGISKDDIEYYLGKKSRHANNYGMKPPRMSDSLAKEGYAVTVRQCSDILDKVHQFDPSVRNVFHTYIRDEIERSMTLRAPLGRERVFFGFRANEHNGDLWNDAYAWIPQSTVGDNTGLAVLDLELAAGDASENCIVAESHDSVMQEFEPDESCISAALMRIRRAFDRRIRFDNGIEINIPIEAELGTSLSPEDFVKVKTFDKAGVCDVLQRLRR